MQINDQLLQSLLYEEESVELDVKRDQYRFIKATDEEKGELLKDILAFANAWRRSDAFIMIGVKEVKGGKNKVVGITEPLDDATIQQFVNSKTQRLVSFSYRNVPLEGKTIGLIHIPVQRRPFYLIKGYGKLIKEAVYVRHGTSTDIADPDEIAQMGSSSTQIAGFPELDVFFCDPENRLRLAETPVISSLVLITPDEKSIQDYSPKRYNPWGLSALDPLQGRVNYNYYRKLVKYTKVSQLVSPLFFAITNLSEITAHDARLEIKLPGKTHDVVALDGYDFPDVPKSVQPLWVIPRFDETPRNYEITVRNMGSEWLVKAQIEKVQPKSTYWIEDPLYLGALVSIDVELDVSVFADNLPEPHQQKLLVRIEAEKRQVDLDGVLLLERERMRSDPKYSYLFKQKETLEK